MKYRVQPESVGFGIGWMWTKAVKVLVIACVVLYAVEHLVPGAGVFIPRVLGLAPGLVRRGMVWQFLTYMFLHGGLLHLIFNMLVLWMFGGQLELAWGTRAFLKYYVICGLGGGLLHFALSYGSFVPLVGASGAIYGLLLAYGLLFPDAVIYLYFLFPVKAKYMVLILGVIEFLASLTSVPLGGGRVSHLAHLGGLLAGFVYLKGGDRVDRWRRRLRRRWDTHGANVVDMKRAKARRHQEEIDAILDKISSQGLESLTPRERRRLREAGSEDEDRRT